MKRLSLILGIIDTTSHWAGRVASFGLVIIVGSLLFEIVGRYAFNSPTLWAHELSTYVNGSIGVLAGAYTLRHRGHIIMDFFYSRFSPRLKAGLDVFTAFLFFSFAMTLLWYGTEIALRSIQLQEHSYSAWAPIMWPVRITLPLAAFLILLQGIAKWIRDLVYLTRGREI